MTHKVSKKGEGIMNKLENVIKTFDNKVDQQIKPFAGFFKRYFPVFSITILSLILIFFVLRHVHQKPYFKSFVIASDLKTIVEVLEKIDEDCSILGFEHAHNHLDFLSVEKFSGSEIGSMNVAYPTKWRGPYLGDTIEYQGKPYQLVKAKDGYFVMPGEGVKLPNKVVVGKDVVIKKDTTLSEMIKKGGKLNYQGIPLAVKIEFVVGDWSKRKLTPKQMESISKDLQEFNEAMPFAQNEGFLDISSC